MKKLGRARQRKIAVRGFTIHNGEREDAANQGISEAANAGVAPGVALNPPDADLARVVSAWPEMPEAIRRAVLALIDRADS